MKDLTYLTLVLHERKILIIVYTDSTIQIQENCLVTNR
jgi:hypothetical protein